MKTLRLLVLGLLALLPAAQAQALDPDRILPALRIKPTGDVMLDSRLRIGRDQSGKFIGTPERIEIQGPGSTGDASGLSVTAQGGNTARTNANRWADVANVLDFGADATNTSDSTAAFRAAIATGRRVYVPKGQYRINDLLTLNTHQKMFGDSRTTSVLRVSSSTVNMSALGIVRLATAETAASIDDIGIRFDQPDTSVRANIVAFPTAIIATAAPRFQINRVRVTGAYNCLDATGNSGGAQINDFECGALNKGMIWDDSHDGVHIHGYHFWNFGFIVGTGLGNIYSDGNTVAAEIGRIDGLDASGWLLWQGTLRFTANAANAGNIVNAFTNLTLDGDHANLFVEAGNLHIGNLYSTKFSVSDIPILVTGGNVAVSNFNINSSASVPSIQVTGGSLFVNGGTINTNTLSVPAATVSTGILAISNTQLSPGAGTWTAPYVSHISGALRVANNRLNAPTAGAPTAFVFSSDNASNLYSGNTLNGWSATFPNGAILGNYGSTYKPTTRKTLDGTAFNVPFSRGGDLVMRFVQPGTIASQTINLNTTPPDGYGIQFVNYAGDVTQLAFSPVVVGWVNLSTFAGKTSIRVRWDAADGQWHREQ